MGTSWDKDKRPWAKPWFSHEGVGAGYGGKVGGGSEGGGSAKSGEWI